ncbi:MAG: AraC family transcriptional regulator [Lachnospiraceae bacterium]|nr:AraC family transcriptional regulator [Lachnospiraceae bacterium]
MKKNLATSYDDRQYMVAKDFELYYYQDKEPVKRTGLHTHPYYEFYFFLEGNVEAQVKSEHCILTYGDILIVPPKTTHGVFIRNFDVPYRRFDLWISVPFYERLLDMSMDFSYCTGLAQKQDQFIIHTENITFNNILSRLYGIIEEEKGSRFGREMRLNILISDLFLTINRLAYEQANRFSGQDQNTLYQNICTYIDNNIDEDLSLDSISEHFFLSKYYLSHVFKDNIGISIHRYISKRRLNLCRDAILSGIPVSQVFDQYGFDDYSSFYRAFKKEYGMSPKELVKQSKII